MHCFWDIRLQKCCDLENRVMGLSRSLKMSPFNTAHMKSAYWRSIATMDLSRTVSEIDGDSSRKSQKFSRPSCLNCVPAERVPLELGTDAWVQRRNLMISSAVWIQCTNVTDGQTPGDSKDRAYAYRRAVKTTGQNSVSSTASHLLTNATVAKKNFWVPFHRILGSCNSKAWLWLMTSSYDFVASLTSQLF